MAVKMDTELKSIYDKAVRFHGHPGVFLAIGIRMGLLALEYLKSKGYFELEAFVQTRERPPYLCILDGIQFSTGCTIGKGNLEINYSADEIFGVFKTQSGKKIEIKVLPELLEQIKKQIKGMDRFKMDEVVKEILEMDETALFLCKR
ncbi:MAG: formylmethanofuran dehydrogenase subunit E family protein [Candidatus Lokiarchaeota archaeon]|nr:formylmethanofuran dehydrogenase subunit E family protein [Candidatus Lokiarchaeota archaeon]